MARLGFLRLLWVLTIVLASTALAQDTLPQVDLGYEIHQAISFNSTGQTYNFTNIRYAQPPIGDLRFAAPVSPVGQNPVVQNGSVGVICPQANPGWIAIAAKFIPAFLTGQSFDYDATLAALQASNATAPPPDPRTTEDCLFLDVIVPKAVFDAPQTGNYGGNGAPVLVWVEDAAGNPSGLIKASQADDDEGFIFVAINYRLGAMGWSAGTLLQSEGGVPNAGLYDQRLAIEWVRDNIHLFGGDPDRITLIGESSGGGSIMHQITAYGGTQGVAFQQAIPQSPGFLLQTDQDRLNNITEDFLALLNVSSIAEARQLPSSAVIAANAEQVLYSAYGDFTYSPAVDGTFVPDVPGKLLLEGRFAKNLTVMVGHNADEGLVFTDPRVSNDTALAALIKFKYPLITDAVLAYLLTTLYPPIYDGSYGYTSAFTRTVVILSESAFTCNTNYLDQAYNNATYAYQFSVPPALHGDDVPYTFYNGPSSDVVAQPIAMALQAYLTYFAKNGMPNGPAVPYFPLYGIDATEQNLNITGIMPMRDPTANPRCLWWQQALYA